MNRIELSPNMDLSGYDLVVFGTSLPAAVVAHIAAKEYRYKVLVIDRNNEIKGAYGHETETGTEPYVISSYDGRLRNFLQNITECTDCIFDWKLSKNGKEHNFTSNFDALSYVMPKYQPDKIDSAEGHLEAILCSILSSEEDNSIDELLTTIDLSSSCIGKRPFNFYPSKGYRTMIEKMLSNPCTDIAFGADVNEILHVDSDDTVLLWGAPSNIPVVYSYGLNELFGMGTDGTGCIGLVPITDEGNCDAKSAILTQIFCSDDESSDGLDLPVTFRWEITADGSGIPYLPLLGDSREKKTRAEMLAKADRAKMLYLCGPKAKHNYMNVEEMVIEGMSVFSNIEFTHEINLLPDYVSERRPLEQLLSPGDCFAKREMVKSNLLIGDLQRPVPKISIIIPTYKRLASLKRTLLCATMQDIDDSEYDIVVVDNDPEPDNDTHNFLKTCNIRNLFYYKSQENLGAYGNMNRCIELCRTEWISMVHDDDAIFSNSLRWALNSIDFINDDRLGMVIPRQVQIFDSNEISRRLPENGEYRKKSWGKLKSYSGSVMYRSLLQMNDRIKRRYWKISKRDCYVIPFLYPAPSYGTLINRNAMLDIGGYGEGYPNDDGLCSIRMSEKYSVYLCGEAWGMYSMSTADYTKPKSAVQFVECTEQYREYMHERDLFCRIMGRYYCPPMYIDSVHNDINAITGRLGYCLNKKNYPHYKKYDNPNMNYGLMIGVCMKFQHLWQYIICIRAYLFGKKITKKQIEKCNGEHY